MSVMWSLLRCGRLFAARVGLSTDPFAVPSRSSVLSLLPAGDYSLPTMAGKLCNMATRIMGGSSLVGRSLSSSSLHFRSGMGMPVGKHIVPDKPLSVHDELTWDNGTPFPEPCIDRIAPTVGKYEALAWMCGGLGFFAGLALLAVWNDKASKIPFTPKVYPYDNLRVELGGEP